jgi:hypothetical protein
MSPLEKLEHSLKKRINLKKSRAALNLTPYPIEYYTSLLSKNIPFSFVRYGDGEWSAIFERSGANCDGHSYTKELGAGLSRALKEQYPYFYAMQNRALKEDGAEIIDFCEKNNLKQPFHYADIFAVANVRGELYPFIKCLREKSLVIIGPGYLNELSSIFTLTHFFEVPQKNCFSAADRICGNIAAWGKNKTGIVYSFSASMAANVMIHDLFKDLGKNNWLLDLGSLWDIYAKKKSRGWFKKLDLQPAIDRNTGVYNDKGFWKNMHDSIILAHNRFKVKKPATIKVP